MLLVELLVLVHAPTCYGSGKWLSWDDSDTYLDLVDDLLRVRDCVRDVRDCVCVLDELLRSRAAGSSLLLTMIKSGV